MAALGQPAIDFGSLHTPAVQLQIVQAFLVSRGEIDEIGNILSSDTLSQLLLEEVGIWPRVDPNKECPECHRVPMTTEDKASSAVGWRYKCNKGPRGNRCRKTVYPTTGTFLERMKVNKISPKQIVAIMYTFCAHLKPCHACPLLKAIPKTVRTWYGMFREVMQVLLYHEWDQDGPIGGPGDTVEIDEAHLANRKYNRGDVLRSQTEWVFGGVCRRTNRCFTARVMNRDENSLIPLIRRFINPESLIISDGWSVYTNNLNAGNGFPNHQWVNHSENFVDPNDDSVNTQKIERFWRDVREWVGNYDAKS